MNTRDKVQSISDFQLQRDKISSESIVFTNGCFDILHSGHIDYLEQASTLGDLLVVGLNSDESVKRIKPGNRPVNAQQDRARVLAGLACVYRVLIFNEDTPYELIKKVRPHVLVKGGDWPVEKIAGRDIVLAAGGKVLNIAITRGYSTTNIINKIINSA
ncbi:D-glycero-beta-D-manno-heptose 1-phosphate adenylyltransferase [Desulfonatronovibrio magnus]|uniref:D-glycero-beta-D-manno-heptose 1-phosphate adenylyltransferase n=1 Tax=Desulfonatronovibrio magnus TaxID=698827 RepID=UPI0009FFFACE|nr:D-glycero-beta-D-manno-heptose 1-phosphate adenylyltransferase [Desulfonatronovibrio magnus]